MNPLNCIATRGFYGERECVNWLSKYMGYSNADLLYSSQSIALIFSGILLVLFYKQKKKKKWHEWDTKTRSLWFLLIVFLGYWFIYSSIFIILTIYQIAGGVL